MQKEMSKKDDLKAGLITKKSIKKKPVIEEGKAEAATRKIHKATDDPKAEPTTKTSVDIRKSLYKAMKLRLIEKEMSMRDYLESLIEADINQ
jgi:hypothetical protein